MKKADIPLPTKEDLKAIMMMMESMMNERQLAMKKEIAEKLPLYNTVLREIRGKIQMELLPEVLAMYSTTAMHMPTGAWNYDGIIHRIMVHPLAHHMIEKENNDIPEFIRTLVKHESLHAVGTERDNGKIAALGKRLNAIKPCSFAVLNVFEDSRIEACGRDGRATIDGAPVVIPWRDYEYTVSELLASGKIDTSHITPIRLMINCTISQGDKAERELCERSLGDMAKKVHAYHDRICACNSTMELEPILIDWINDFPSETRVNGGTGGKGKEGEAGDGKGGKKGYTTKTADDEDGSAFGSSKSEKKEEKKEEDSDGGDEDDSDSDGEGDGDPDFDYSRADEATQVRSSPTDRLGQKGDAKFVPRTLAEMAKDGEDCPRTNHYESKGLGSASNPRYWVPMIKESRTIVQPRLRDVMRQGDRKEFSVAPKGRLSLRHIVGQLPTIFAEKKIKGDNKPLKLRVILDCSGSMQTVFLRRGIGAIMHALAELNEQGEVKVDCWLSGDSSYSHLDKLTGPMVRGFNIRGGNEAIGLTLKKSNDERPHAEFDTVLILTDGQIEDGEVQLKDFNNLPNGMAVYIPNTWPMEPNMMDRMRTQFPVAICQPDIQTATDAMCRRIKENRIRRRKFGK